ncbi:hypothetical protein DPEC_G00134900 [Dallia pectoralis]|uniref:Uncharacterized protein n=1 Tax=Dallia pectoralis TaxID=75939 RepID=A0ACC2GRY1_DALPE|nr:hypothetical protein DPEC_G00134900 [Dallia pectoralis]
MICCEVLEDNFNLAACACGTEAMAAPCSGHVPGPGLAVARQSFAGPPCQLLHRTLSARLAVSSLSRETRPRQAGWPVPAEQPRRVTWPECSENWPILGQAYGLLQDGRDAGAAQAEKFTQGNFLTELQLAFPHGHGQSSRSRFMMNLRGAKPGPSSALQIWSVHRSQTFP